MKNSPWLFKPDRENSKQKEKKMFHKLCCKWVHTLSYEDENLKLYFYLIRTLFMIWNNIFYLHDKKKIIK